MKVELGQRVKYVRLRPDGEVHEGEGVAVVLFLNSDRRVMVGVLDGEDRHNIDLVAIDADEAQKQVYLEHMRRVRTFAEEKNAENKALVEAGNAVIEGWHTEVLGAPVVHG